MTRTNRTPVRLAHDRMMATQAIVATLLTEAAKLGSVLNGGAAVAMLGLMQALVDKDLTRFHNYKPYGLHALEAFVIGAIASGLTLFARWQLAFWSDVEAAEWWRRICFVATFLLLVASLGAFAFGCTAAGWGMAIL